MWLIPVAGFAASTPFEDRGGRVTLELAPFVLKEVLGDLLALMSSQADVKGIELSIETPADLPLAFTATLRASNKC